MEKEKVRLIDRLLYEKSRKEKRMVKQAEVAKAVGVNGATLYQLLTGYMTGVRSPSVVNRLAEYFGKSPEWLLKEIKKERGE